MRPGRKLDAAVLRELAETPEEGVEVVLDAQPEPNAAHGLNSRKELRQQARHLKVG